MGTGDREVGRTDGRSLGGVQPGSPPRDGQRYRLGEPCTSTESLRWKDPPGWTGVTKYTPPGWTGTTKHSPRVTGVTQDTQKDTCTICVMSSNPYKQRRPIAVEVPLSLETGSKIFSRPHTIRQLTHPSLRSGSRVRELPHTGRTDNRRVLISTMIQQRIKLLTLPHIQYKFGFRLNDLPRGSRDLILLRVTQQSRKGNIAYPFRSCGP